MGEPLSKKLRKRQSLFNSHRQSRWITIDLEASVRELMRSNMELQEFSYIAAHDLKTPLRGIATLADWISTDCADKLDDDGRQHVSLLLARTRQMDAMVDGVMQYSSIRQSERRRQQIDLNAVLSEVIATMQVPEQIQISKKNELPVLNCEKEHMAKVFRNLLDNAIKHGVRSDGQVRIGCVKQDHHWKFSVSDNGPGIEEKYFKKIFRIFETLSSREQSGSTGVGLSIVRKIVELNGGSIWVESEVGKGATFCFTLPMHMTASNVKPKATRAAC